MRFLTLAISLVISSFSQADWALQQPSSVHFLTNKNTHIAEIHRFKAFTAEVKDSGFAQINIDLSSVDTRIGIRDERMNEHLFEVSRFASARFEAEIPATVLAQVSAGQSSRFQLSGKVSLHGEQAQAQCEVLISPNKDKTITVSSITPMIIDAQSFNLVAGINKLQQIAGLKSITHTVPVTFSLTFKAN